MAPSGEHGRAPRGRIEEYAADADVDRCEEGDTKEEERRSQKVSSLVIFIRSRDIYRQLKLVLDYEKGWNYLSMLVIELLPDRVFVCIWSFGDLALPDFDLHEI